jgi:adenine/guanine phosphoribosyltransferase-like PRPP-binding protein
MLAAALAYEYGLGIVPVRKPAKLPWRITGRTTRSSTARGG